MYAATFIVTPMNSRIRNLYVTLIHIFLGTMLIIIYLQLKNDAAFYNSNNQNILKNNFFPISAIVYLHIARIIYILITKNEPITTFKGDKKGDWNATAKREITNNDIKWSVISKLILAAILISIAASTV